MKSLMLLGRLPLNDVLATTCLANRPVRLELPLSSLQEDLFLREEVSVFDHRLYLGGLLRDGRFMRPVVYSTKNWRPTARKSFTLLPDMRPFCAVHTGLSSVSAGLPTANSSTPLVVSGIAHQIVYHKGQDSAVGVGSNMRGQLGLPSLERFTTFQRLQLPRGEHILKICCGLDHTALLTLSHKLFLCGLNTDNQLGHSGMLFSNKWTQVRIPSKAEEPVIDVVCGDDFVFALTARHNWYSWGNNECLQLLVNSYSDKVSTPLLSELSSMGVSSLALGTSTGLGIYAGDRVALWGSVGPGVDCELDACQVRTYVFPGKVVKVLCYGFIAGALLENGQLYVWGKNHDNLLGIDENLAFVDTPTLLDVPGTVSDFVIANNNLLVVFYQP